MTVDPSASRQVDTLPYDFGVPGFPRSGSMISRIRQPGRVDKRRVEPALRFCLILTTSYYPPQHVRPAVHDERQRKTFVSWCLRRNEQLRRKQQPLRTHSDLFRLGRLTRGYPQIGVRGHGCHTTRSVNPTLRLTGPSHSYRRHKPVDVLEVPLTARHGAPPGVSHRRTKSVAKTAMKTANQAVQIFGGNGYMREYEIERFMRDAKITEIYEGTSEIQKIVISREIIKRYSKA